MQILTHRIDQKVVLPNVGVSLQVLRVRENTVTVGIEVPTDVSFSHHQLDDENDSTDVANDGFTSPSDENVRDHLIQLAMTAGRLRRELRQGSFLELDDTVDTLTQQLFQLDQAINGRGKPPKADTMEPPTASVTESRCSHQLLACV